MGSISPQSAQRTRGRIVAEVILFALGFTALLFALRLDRVWFEHHLTQSFCASDPKQLHRLTAVRVGALLVAAFLIFIARPLLGKWIAANTAKNAAISIFRISLAIALALLVSTLILRARRAPEVALAPPALPPIHSDAEMGWVGDENTTVILRADDREIPYSFNADGYRVASQADVIDADAPTILFAGESITEGVGVRFEESYPSLVAADFHVQTVEAAVHGYGNDLIYLAMQKELAKLHHPLAVITLIIPQLLERDLDWTRPHLVLDDNGAFQKIPASAPRPAWWEASPLRKLIRGLFPYHDDSSIDLARAIFRATATEAKAKGAYSLVVMTNWGEPCLPPDPGHPTLDGVLFDGLDVPWIDVRLDPNDQEHSTYHPNAKAHRTIADAIERKLVEAKIATQ